MDKIGIYKDGIWLLDLNDNQQFDGCEVDRCVILGGPDTVPVVERF